MSSRVSGHTIAGVPVLIAKPAVPTTDTPVVLWHHGFRADALAHATELERCADLGFLAVGVDAVEHGARRDPTLDARVSAAGGALHLMLDQVERTIAELPALLTALAQRHPVDPGRVSMVGISMGAFLTYRALADRVTIRAAVALLGAVEWTGHPRSPHRDLPLLCDTALLSITAEHDSSVSPASVAQLHATLAETCTNTGAARHEHLVLRGAGHLTTAEEWRTAMTATMQWIKRWG
jgi:uncharacterized protein